MTTPVNVAQENAWNGEEGRRWTEHHRHLDRMAEPANEHLFAGAGIAESDRVLDIGCGTGQTTRIAARHARRGQVVGIDLSAPMLELARRIAAEESLANITFERGDAQVHPFPSRRFDVAISRAGVMFFDDPVAAFANIRRSLRQQGRLAFLCHRHGGDRVPHRARERCDGRRGLPARRTAGGLHLRCRGHHPGPSPGGVGVGIASLRARWRRTTTRFGMARHGPLRMSLTPANECLFPLRPHVLCRDLPSPYAMSWSSPGIGR
ncbi:class I SAM-dependent methyltransferase [Microbispora hainanensis]|uniref:Class I SAM-dependent methyltransferase n=1 Tax=Microbispora hainanensis TaxID=568844 RepID=A0A544YVE0_9ACTN|nr:class I SAM-dependent methyltransferase [Microbispora hainanensis]